MKAKEARIKTEMLHSFFITLKKISENHVKTVEKLDNHKLRC